MNARNTLFAMFALASLAASAFAQDWTSEATYTKTVTTTTVTTYTPSYETTGYVQPWNNTPGAAPAPQPQPTVVQANYVQPAYQRAGQLAADVCPTGLHSADVCSADIYIVRPAG